jgi:hypothetical protein
MGTGPNGTRNLEMARKAKETPHLRLRIEPSLLARIQKSADKNERTLTGEVVDRLEASFKREDMQAYIDATAQKIKEDLVAGTAALNTAADRYRIINKEMFELDLKVLSELYPDRSVEEHTNLLREANARRAAYAAKESQK